MTEGLITDDANRAFPPASAPAPITKFHDFSQSSSISSIISFQFKGTPLIMVSNNRLCPERRARSVIKLSSFPLAFVIFCLSLNAACLQVGEQYFALLLWWLNVFRNIGSHLTSLPWPSASCQYFSRGEAGNLALRFYVTLTVRERLEMPKYRRGE